jgi:glycosyltransferase involved in cell wall biosynthesis
LLAGAKAPQVHLVLVGDGPERARIQQAIRTFGLEGAVTLTGQVPSAEPYYGIADIAVLSSLTEGSPNALLEAMAAGIPVVATKVGGIPEIATHGETALLISPGDREAMTRALEDVASNDFLAQSMARRAQDLVRSRHTPEARTACLIGIYSKIISADGLRT